MLRQLKRRGVINHGSMLATLRRTRRMDEALFCPAHASDTQAEEVLQRQILE